MKNLLTKLLNDNAVIPTYGSDRAAGMDLYAAFAETIPVGKQRIVKTGIAVQIPDGFYGRIAPRSGLAYKNGIDVFAGVVDNDYRGEIGIILYNAGNEPFHVQQGDRVAQMIITPYEMAMPYVVEDLDDTGRGSGGFGSTGK